MYKSAYQIVLYSILLGLSACQKETDWLDKKPNKALVVPVTISDFEGLMNNESLLNTNDGCLGFMAVEDYYVTDAVWQARPTATERNSYTWEKDIYEGESAQDWVQGYKQVYYCNIVLEGLTKMTDASKVLSDWKQLRGTALFFRSFALFKMAATFCVPYDKSTAGSDLGLPLQLSSDPNKLQQRASVQQTYDQILSDLKEAETLLPETVTLKSKPSKTAAQALLARIYLSIENYEDAWQYANNCLTTNAVLLDYNTLNSSVAFPFSLFNVEDVFHSRMLNYSIFGVTLALADSNLYKSYQPNDLRRVLFFKITGSNISFKGSYEGSAAYYSGIANDELFLIRAECAARKGNTAAALADLNTLLQKRWKTGSYTPFTTANTANALSVILTERRKELVFRTTRWTDLRRLNRDPAFAVTLTRVINAKTYTLLPGSQLYVLPIPDNEIVLNGLTQNAR